MNTFRMMATTLSLFALVSLGACGGGGGGTSAAPPPPPPPPPPTGGIGRNGVAVGTVSNFGSIFVNGVEYDTDAAAFTVNGQPGSQSDLSVGNVVTVDGTIDDNGTTGTADTVMLDDLVKGPVDSINIPGNSLVVMGQTVFVTLDTSFDNAFSPAALEGVSLGQIVEVSGQFTDIGDIVATRIEPKPAGTPFEVHGTVSSLDNTNMLFSLRGLVVDFSSATIQNFPGGQITDGDFVEAKGTSIGSAGELTATIVELKSRVPGTNDGDRVEIEGFITNFVSATDFDVDGMPVTTNGATVFTGGVAGDLALNVKVEVEGDVDANGLLTAEKVDIRRPKIIRIVADVDSVDTANNTLVMLGITVTVDSLTRLEDKRSGTPVSPLNLGDINPTDYVEARGAVDPNATAPAMLASVLEVDDASTRVILQGLVETVGASSYTVLGVTVNTDAGTEFFDANDLPISSTAFFADVAANSLVKARGAEASDTTITADQVEFEVEF